MRSALRELFAIRLDIRPGTIYISVKVKKMFPSFSKSSKLAVTNTPKHQHILSNHQIIEEENNVY